MEGWAPRARPVDGLVAVAATVKGPVASVSAFVDGNLRAGADHLFVFVDDADPDVLASFADHPFVTAVGTDAAHWGAQGRPVSLNRRQGVNANVANVLACAVPRIAWVFALDLDERLSIDKRRLLRLKPSRQVVALRTWEGAASETEDVRGWYKPWPTVKEMESLHRDGVIDDPTLFGYFRGHHGKRGWRPDVDKRIEMHRVRGMDRRPVTPYSAPWLVVLHDESVTFEEFQRKWEALLTAGGCGQGPERQQLGELVRSALEVPDQVEREHLLRALFREHVVDDVASLRERGLLVHPPAREHVPQPLTPEERAAIDGLCALFRGRSKDSFVAGYPRSRRRLERLVRRTQDDPVLAPAHRALRTALRSEGSDAPSRRGSRTARRSAGRSRAGA